MTDALVSTERRNIPGLDGLRALSIVFVIAAHAIMNYRFLPNLPQLAELGTLGVEIFFAISGYLITTLLLREWSRDSAIDLSGFYIRRVTRIFPAYYVFLVICAIGIAIGFLSAAGGRWWPAPLYLSNLITTNNLIGHSWSLSVEEQFYLTWPLAVSKWGPRRASVAAIIAVLTAPIFRIGLYVFTRNGWLASSWNHDFIAMGCLLALLERGVLPGGSVLLSRLLRTPVVIVASLALLVLHVGFGETRNVLFAVRLGALLSVEALCAALVVGWTVRNSASVVGRLLEAKPVRTLGVLSYSLYLWQQPFLFRYVPMQWWASLLGTLVCAWLSYRLVERPALALRRRFTSTSSTESFPRYAA